MRLNSLLFFAYTDKLPTEVLLVKNSFEILNKRFLSGILYVVSDSQEHCDVLSSHILIDIAVKSTFLLKENISILI